MSIIEYMPQLFIILIIGLIIGIISRKLKLPSVLLLILAGAILNNIFINGQAVFHMPSELLISIVFFMLIIVVFNDVSSFSIHELNTYGEEAFKIALMFISLSILFFSIATHFVMGFKSIILSLLFTAVISSTDPTSLLLIFKDKTNKIFEILKYESVINTPIVIVIMVILLGFMQNESGILNNLANIYPFIQQLLIGIGTGIIVAIIVFKFMSKVHHEKISPILLLLSALFTYLLANFVGGFGILAVAVFAIFFEKTSIHKKAELKEFSKKTSIILGMVVFVIIGFMLPINLKADFLFKSLLLFIILLIIRFASIFFVFMNEHFSMKEMIFMSLNVEKGLTVAVIILVLSHYIIAIPLEIINLSILFMLYSIILSSIAAHSSKYFLGADLEE